MEKIPTIFKRDWEGDRKVVNELVDTVARYDFANATATEKVDGTNVRVTIRKGTCVRLEKRNNPSRLQKAKGITEPWYIDADLNSSQDKWIYDALQNTDLTQLPDGEWSAEAFGKNIQGNPLQMEGNQLMFFSLGQAPVLTGVPVEFEALKEWLKTAKSKIGPGALIEGIVWHHPTQGMAKIKRKDFGVV